MRCIEYRPTQSPFQEYISYKFFAKYWFSVWNWCSPVVDTLYNWISSPANPSRSRHNSNCISEWMILSQSHSLLEGYRPYPLQGPFPGWWLMRRFTDPRSVQVSRIWLKNINEGFLLLIPYPSDLPAHGHMAYGSVINNSSVSGSRDSLLINILSVGLSDRLINCLSLDRGDLWRGRICRGKDPREPLSSSPIL